VGSHYHFIETNAALSFDRAQAPPSCDDTVDHCGSLWIVTAFTDGFHSAAFHVGSSIPAMLLRPVLQSYGFRLNVPSGASVRFEPGESKAGARMSCRQHLL